MRTNYRRWSEYPYPGELVPPQGSPEAGYWPMFFISRDNSNVFLDPFHQRINWNIKNPNDINWDKELFLVRQTLSSLTPEQLHLAQFWGTVDINKRLSYLILNLTDKYQLGSPDTARTLGYFHAAINDAFVITWFLKYLWDAARPCQYDASIASPMPTPRFPGYPSAHATVAGCAEAVLRYFFPQEAYSLNIMMEDSAQSRLYAGVHFKVDNDEGLRLGRQIGEIVVTLLRAQNQVQ